MEPSATVAQLEKGIADLLDELSAVQDQLLELLARKRDAMAATDLEGMLRLQPAEEQLCQRLEQCHRRRAELLETAAAAGVQADSIGQLSQQLAGQQPSSLQKQTGEAAARMRLLQHESLTNWVLAQRWLLHVSQMIEIIASGGQLQPTYGNGQPIGSRGALVDREV